jgi:hypothetical protein
VVRGVIELRFGHAAVNMIRWMRVVGGGTFIVTTNRGLRGGEVKGMMKHIRFGIQKCSVICDV